MAHQSSATAWLLALALALLAASRFTSYQLLADIMAVISYQLLVVISYWSRSSTQ
jgi:hypothetical protein